MRRGDGDKDTFLADRNRTETMDHCYALESVLLQDVLADREHATQRQRVVCSVLQFFDRFVVEIVSCGSLCLVNTLDITQGK